MTISETPHEHLELFEQLDRPRHQLPLDWPRVQLAGATTDLFDADDAVGLIIDHAENPNGHVLGVVSVNLDHLHHFGSGRKTSRAERAAVVNLSMNGRARWLALLDGAPLVKRAGELTGRPWPRLAGSDLIEPLLTEAENRGLSVGFLGGAPSTHEMLRPVMRRRWPRLRVAGYWAPTRADLDDPARAADLAAEVNRAKADVLAVCLGKPRQERWIAEYGADSGAAVCLAFGAVVDFLAGRVERAPRLFADHGFEWLWRLANEPKRLARRYLVQGPSAYVALQRDSFAILPTTYFPDLTASAEGQVHASALRRFTPVTRPADVGVILIGDPAGLPAQIDSLRDEIGSQEIRVVAVVDHDVRVALPDDVIVAPAASGRDVGQRINAGRRAIGDVQNLLVLGAGLQVERGSIRALSQRLLHAGVSAALPRILDQGGWVEPTLMHARTPVRRLADAVVGDGLRSRAEWTARTIRSPRVYRYAHPIVGANELAIMLPAEVDQKVGEWRPGGGSELIDDYLERSAEVGGQAWFEPLATFRRSGQARTLQTSRRRA